jgi:hypothetical protein
MARYFLLSCFMLSWLSGWTLQPIEGYWKNDRAKITIIVEQTPDGIRTKRLDQTQWYTYSKIRKNFYRDREGNTYFLIDDNQLEWENQSGLKKIRFQRTNAPSEYKSDIYADRQTQYIVPVPDPGSSAKLLEGRWINRTTRQTIRIKANRKDLKVRTSRSGWRQFDWTGDAWQDRFGNVYYVDNGRLFYSSRSGDLILRFESL